jgi:hypothetical protein
MQRWESWVKHGVVAWVLHRKLSYINKMHSGPGKIWSAYGNMETKKSRIFDTLSIGANPQVIEKRRIIYATTPPTHRSILTPQPKAQPVVANPANVNPASGVTCH